MNLQLSDNERISIPFTGKIVQKRVRTFETKESGTVEWIRSMNGGVFVDVGANIGLYSALASLYVDTVIAIEPHPANCFLLRQIVDHNKLTNIKTVCAGCDCCDQEISGLLIKSMTNGSSGHQVGVASSHFVASLHLDVILNCLGHTPNHIKIDVDGAEDRVVRGASFSISQSASVLCEVREKTDSDVVSEMKKHGFINDPAVQYTSGGKKRIKRQEKPRDWNLLFTK